MKIKKTVSEKVIAANRRNARKSTGPEDVSAIKNNAMKHGLLAKRLAFLTEDQAEEFKALRYELEKDFAPQGAVQGMLLEEVAVTWWKLRLAVGWEMEDIANRQEASRELLRRFIHNSQDEQLSSLSSEDGRPAAFSTWECQGAVLRSRSKSRGEDLLSDERESKDGGSEMELRITTALDTILRYQTSLKRDFYRAIQMLHSLQDRKARGNAPQDQRAVKGSVNDNFGSDFAKQTH
jgi:hypothetical protein